MHLNRIFYLLMLMLPVLARADYKGFPTGYCTYYAAIEFDKAAPTPRLNWSGNAGNWAANAAAKGWPVAADVRSAPQLPTGSIVCWQNGGAGHVAVLRSADANGIVIDEMNWDAFNSVSHRFLTYDQVAIRGNNATYTFAGYVTWSVSPDSAPNMASNAVPKVVNDANGNHVVLVRDQIGRIWSNQWHPVNGWHGWQDLGGNVAGDPTPCLNGEGRIEFFVRGIDRQIYVRWQTTPAGAWSDQYDSLGGYVDSDPAVSNNADGRLQIFVRGTDNAIYTRWQQSLSGNWSAWNSFGGNVAGNPTAIRRQNGYQEVYVRGHDGHIYARFQYELNGAWNPWNDFGGNATGALVATLNGSGRLQNFIRSTDDAVYSLWETAPVGGWQGWSLIGSPWAGFASQPAASLSGTGHLKVVARGWDDAIYVNDQTSSGGWGTWQSLGGNVSNDPAIVCVGSVGRAEVFVRGKDGHVYHKWELPGGGWSGWADLR